MAGPGPSTGGQRLFWTKLGAKTLFIKKISIVILEDQKIIYVGQVYNKNIDRRSWLSIRLFLEEMKKGAKSFFRKKGVPNVPYR